MGRPSRAQTVAKRPVPADWTLASLGERVDHICRLRKWSLTELGERSGHDPGVMSRLAARKERVAGTPELLDSVARAAGISVEWLTYGRGPIEVMKGTLKEHDNWKEVLAEAQRRQRGIPNEFWELAGATVFPTPRALDWQLLVGLVRELYWAHQRYLDDEAIDNEASSQDEARATQAVAGEGTAAVQTHAQWGGARRQKKDKMSA